MHVFHFSLSTEGKDLLSVSPIYRWSNIQVPYSGRPEGYTKSPFWDMFQGAVEGSQENKEKAEQKSAPS